MTGATLPHDTAPRLRTLGQDLLGLALITLAGLAGYALFPDDLAFLTRVVSVALLVLSLDLIVGYCGIASLRRGRSTAPAPMPPASPACMASPSPSCSS
ncbi:hypothetical protein BTHI11S_03296 [Bosea thiooxidans]